MDQEVKDFIGMWKKKKDSFADDWKRGTPSGRGRRAGRLVETRFVYRGMEYSLRPESIGLNRDDPWDQGFMEYLQSDIEKDLRKMGAVRIWSTGFLY